MPSVLPATGSAISFGRVYTAYTNASPSGASVRLSATLGASYGGKVAGAQISFSSTFGGKTAPYTY